MPDKCPGGGGREWARCLELTEPLSVTSSQFACQFIHSGFLSATAQVASSSFFTWGWGRGGGGRATALSQKQPCFRARSHESGYFWDCMFFLRHSTFRPHENNEPAHRNPKPKPETRNLHHFKTALQSVRRPNPAKKRAVSTGFQPRFNLFLIVNVVFLETITVLILLHIFTCFKLFCWKATRTEKVTYWKNCFEVFFPI